MRGCVIWVEQRLYLRTWILSNFARFQGVDRFPEGCCNFLQNGERCSWTSYPTKQQHQVTMCRFSVVHICVLISSPRVKTSTDCHHGQLWGWDHSRAGSLHGAPVDHAGDSADWAQGRLWIIVDHLTNVLIYSDKGWCIYISVYNSCIIHYIYIYALLICTYNIYIYQLL